MYKVCISMHACSISVRCINKSCAKDRSMWSSPCAVTGHPSLIQIALYQKKSQEYNLCGNFHTGITMCMESPIVGLMPLCYDL